MSNARQSEILTLTVQLPRVLRDQMLLHMSGTSRLCAIDIHIKNYADSSVTHEDRCICLVIDHDPERLIKQKYRDTVEIDSLNKRLEYALLEIEQLKSLQGSASNDSDSKVDSMFSATAAQSPIALARLKKSGR